MIVLDASVLIAHLDASDALHHDAKDLLLRAGSEELGAATITLAEVMVGPARAGRLTEARGAIERLGIQEVPQQGSAERLAVLRAETGLKMPDCCVLEAAERTGGRLATFDRSLERIAADRGMSLSRD